MPMRPLLARKPHPPPDRRAFYTQMNKNEGHGLRAKQAADDAAAAMQQMELYCAAHPGSPAAVRQPRLFVRGELWIALLGPSVEEGIVGIGPSVTAALRAFDAQYIAGLRPQGKKFAETGAARRSGTAAHRPYRDTKVALKFRTERSDASWAS